MVAIGSFHEPLMASSNAPGWAGLSLKAMYSRPFHSWFMVCDSAPTVGSAARHGEAHACLRTVHRMHALGQVHVGRVREDVVEAGRHLDGEPPLHLGRSGRTLSAAVPTSVPFSLRQPVVVAP